MVKRSFIDKVFPVMVIMSRPMEGFLSNGQERNTKCSTIPIYRFLIHFYLTDLNFDPPPPFS